MGVGFVKRAESNRAGVLEKATLTVPKLCWRAWHLRTGAAAMHKKIGVWVREG